MIRLRNKIGDIDIPEKNTPKDFITYKD